MKFRPKRAPKCEQGERAGNFCRSVLLFLAWCWTQSGSDQDAGQGDAPWPVGGGKAEFESQLTLLSAPEGAPLREQKAEINNQSHTASPSKARARACWPVSMCVCVFAGPFRIRSICVALSRRRVVGAWRTLSRQHPWSTEQEAELRLRRLITPISFPQRSPRPRSFLFLSSKINSLLGKDDTILTILS